MEDYEAMRFTKMIKKVLLFFDTSNYVDFVPALRSKDYGGHTKSIKNTCL